MVDVDYNDFDPTGANPRPDRKERYLLEYIGSVESQLYKGNQVLCQAVNKILGAKEAPKRHACVLEISDKGIKMIDKSKVNVSCVTQCVFDITFLGNQMGHKVMYRLAKFV